MAEHEQPPRQSTEQLSVLERVYQNCMASFLQVWKIPCTGTQRPNIVWHKKTRSANGFCLCKHQNSLQKEVISYIFLPFHLTDMLTQFALFPAWWNYLQASTLWQSVLSTTHYRRINKFLGNEGKTNTEESISRCWRGEELSRLGRLLQLWWCKQSWVERKPLMSRLNHEKHLWDAAILYCPQCLGNLSWAISLKMSQCHWQLCNYFHTIKKRQCSD